MSASVVDPRLQNWFINSSYDNNDQSSYTNTYTQSTPPNPLQSSSNPNINNIQTPNLTDSILPITNINHSHTQPQSQLFGTSIFGDGYNNPSIPSPLVPQPPPNITNINNTPPLTHNSSTPTPPLPNIQLNTNNNGITHLIETLSYSIQEMNQFIDRQENENNCIFKALNAKTINCRNEMVSTLSYYQTYIESKNCSSSTSHSPIHCNNQTNQNQTQSPLNQGLQFPRLNIINNAISDAKLIALDVVGHIINDDNISHTPSHPSPIPLSPIINANSHTTTKSKLNAYAQPYQSYTQTQTQTHINNPSINHLDITPIYNGTNQNRIQEYYNTLAKQQKAEKELKSDTQTQIISQNRILNGNIKENEKKETENNNNILTDNDSITKSNSCDSNNQNKKNIKHVQNTNKKLPKKHKVNKPPLWSAIAKQIVKPTPIISSEEKLPEENINTNNNRLNNRFSSNNYWNTRNRNINNNNYNASISSHSTHSNKSENNNNATPSPSPPINHRMNRRNNNKERCRVFVSNLPPNVTDDDIRNAFSHCGEIANTVWFPSRTDGKFYGSGLITFSDGDGSKEALRMNQQNVLGRIIRCEYSSCQDPVKVKPPGCRTIYLNNVPRDAQESRIREVFKHCGKIKRVRFHERDTKRTGGAFVEFENTASCDKALDLHGKIVDNHPLYVDYQRY